MVTSAGFSGLHQASGFSIGASAIAGNDEGMETGYEGRSVRWQSDLPDPRAIGAEAGRRAVGRTGRRAEEAEHAVRPEPKRTDALL